MRISDWSSDVCSSDLVHKQVVRKRAVARAIELDPAIRLHFVVVQEPEMHNPSGDLERLRAALEEQWGLADLAADLRILQSLQQTLRAGNREVTGAVHRGQAFPELWPGFHDRSSDLALDIRPNQPHGP